MLQILLGRKKYEEAMSDEHPLLSQKSQSSNKDIGLCLTHPFVFPPLFKHAALFLNDENL